MEKILLATLLIFANTILAQDIQMDTLTKTKRLSLGQISNSDDLEINTSSNSIFALIKGTEVNFRLKPDLNAKQVDKAVRYFVDVYYKNLEIDQQNTGTIMKGNSSIDMNLCMGLFKK